MSDSVATTTLLDLLVASAAQRYNFDWAAASEGVCELLDRVEVEGKPPGCKLSAAECEQRYADLLANRGHKSGEAQAIVDRLTSKRLKVLASTRADLTNQMKALERTPVNAPPKTQQAPAEKAGEEAPSGAPEAAPLLILRLAPACLCASESAT